MATAITFPESEPLYDFDRDYLVFRALADDKPVECVVSAELLMARFGASDFTEDALRKAYQEHKAEIRSIVRNHIENGWIDVDGRVFLMKRFTRLNVTFGERYDKSPSIRVLVDSAHRILLDLIGPNAEEVNVEWHGDEAPPHISLQIADPETAYLAKIILSGKDLVDPNRLSVSLALLWSKLLQERSRKLNLMMG